MIDIKSWLNHQQQNTKLKRFDLELLLLNALKVERSWLFSHDDELLSETQLNQLNQWLSDAENNKPIAYILGHKSFWTLELEVTPDTLIPRPETEQIIELALALTHKPQNILDLGTGTGAIALSLAKEWPKSCILATDFCSSALEIAQKNAEKNDIKNVSFKQSDWFKNIVKEQRFDLIVSNPPYIDPKDDHLADLTYEPITALTAENQGLKDLQTLAVESIQHLNSKGTLMLEHGYDQGEAVRNMLEKNGYKHITTHQDLAGHDRITVGQQA